MGYEIDLVSEQDRFKYIEDFDGFKVYLAGPPPMVEAAEKLFPNLGLRKNDIHADAFYNKYEEFQNNE